VKNNQLGVIVIYLIMSVFPSGAAFGIDHKSPIRMWPGAASASTNASAKIINTENPSCEDLRLRTQSSVYTWGHAESRDRRRIDTRCKRAEGQSNTRLVVEYRESNGSTVTISLDDGSVSISPPRHGSVSEQGAADGIHVVNILLHYD